MIIPKNILKFWGVFFIILAVALGVITLIYRWHRIFPTHEVSEIYSRYAKEEGIDAAFVKDYRVNDTLCINATLLEATDTSAWNMIAKDLNVPPPPEIPAEYKELYARANSFSTFVVEKDSINVGDQKIVIQDVYIFSRKDRTICIFHSCDGNQTMAIFHKKIKELKKN
jgi:hypothetical protein